MKTAEKSGGEKPPATVEVLRGAIRAAAADGVSARELARRSGVTLGSILRFTSADRDITFTTAGKLAEALGLELVPKAKGRKKGKG